MNATLKLPITLFAAIGLLLLTASCSQGTIDKLTKNIADRDKTISVQAQQLLEKDVEIKVLTENITHLQEQLFNLQKGLLPYKDTYGDPIHIQNQSDTHNPTWGELCTFLYTDNTTETALNGIKKPEIYKDGIYADCAVTLHDHAELKGIRAGVVIIDRGQAPSDNISPEEYDRFRMFTTFYLQSFGEIWLESIGNTRIVPIPGGFMGNPDAVVVYREAAIHFVETSDDGRDLVWTPMLKPKEGINARGYRMIASVSLENDTDTWLNRDLWEFIDYAKTREEQDGYRLNHTGDSSDPMRLVQLTHVAWEQW